MISSPFLIFGCPHYLNKLSRRNKSLKKNFLTEQIYIKVEKGPKNQSNQYRLPIKPKHHFIRKSCVSRFSLYRLESFVTFFCHLIRYFFLLFVHTYISFMFRWGDFSFQLNCTHKRFYLSLYHIELYLMAHFLLLLSFISSMMITFDVSIELFQCFDF